MFNTVKSIAFATSVSVAALSSAAFAAEPVAFSEVNVEASIDAAQDANALMMYPEIVTDLQAAVRTRIVGSADAGDPTIRIDIRKISLDGDTMLPDNKEFNEIEGVVAITDDNGEIGAQSFAVKVAAYPAEQIVPEGYIAVAPSEADFYAAMINGFADVVAQQVDGLNTAGGEVSK